MPEKPRTRRRAGLIWSVTDTSDETVSTDEGTSSGLSGTVVIREIEGPSIPQSEIRSEIESRAEQYEKTQVKRHVIGHVSE